MGFIQIILKNTKNMQANFSKICLQKVVFLFIRGNIYNWLNKFSQMAELQTGHLYLCRIPGIRPFSMLLKKILPDTPYRASSWTGASPSRASIRPSSKSWRRDRQALPYRDESTPKRDFFTLILR